MRSWAVTRRAPPHPSVALARKRYSGARARLGEPSPYADAAAVGAVPAQMRQKPVLEARSGAATGLRVWVRCTEPVQLTQDA